MSNKLKEALETVREFEWEIATAIANVYSLKSNYEVEMDLEWAYEQNAVMVSWRSTRDNDDAPFRSFPRDFITDDMGEFENKLRAWKTIQPSINVVNFE